MNLYDTIRLIFYGSLSLKKNKGKPEKCLTRTRHFSEGSAYRLTPSEVSLHNYNRYINDISHPLNLSLLTCSEVTKKTGMEERRKLKYQYGVEEEDENSKF
jgi:hypothetical protein